MSLFSRLTPLQHLAEQAGRSLLDVLYPLECAGCGGSGKAICDKCAASLSRLVPPFCEVCAAPDVGGTCQTCTGSGREFDGIRAPFRYEGAIRHAILALKYGGIKAAAPQLGDMLAEYIQANPLPGDLLAPVPMHSSRRRERGYNQADLLARRVADRSVGGGSAGTIRLISWRVGLRTGAEFRTRKTFWSVLGGLIPRLGSAAPPGGLPTWPIASRYPTAAM